MRMSALLGSVVFCMSLLLLAGSSEGGGKDTKDTKEIKLKGFLPQGWKDLGLTAAQKEKIYEIQSKYKAKVDDLKEMEKKIRAEEKSELSKILTDDQKEKLKKLVLGEDPKDTKKPSSEK